MLASEKELLGFYVSGHPLNPMMPLIEKFATHKSSELAALPARSMTRIAGMISAVQKGFSKKSNKPYAMVTLEDLEGSVQILCMNENFDNNVELFVVNKPIMVVGEVNNSEDKPKIFPVEIMALEEAPRKYTRMVHFRLRSERLQEGSIDTLHSLISRHPGRCPVILCFIQPDGLRVFIETHEKFSVAPSAELQNEADALFGEETYYAKADMSLPERERRRWEKKPESNGGGE
jgi:DNA polymerase-3 subunit alpha